MRYERWIQRLRRSSWRPREKRETYNRPRLHSPRSDGFGIGEQAGEESSEPKIKISKLGCLIVDMVAIFASDANSGGQPGGGRRESLWSGGADCPPAHPERRSTRFAAAAAEISEAATLHQDRCRGDMLQGLQAEPLEAEGQPLAAHLRGYKGGLRCVVHGAGLRSRIARS